MDITIDDIDALPEGVLDTTVLTLLSGDINDKVVAYTWCLSRLERVTPAIVNSLLYDEQAPRELLARLSRHPNFAVRAVVATFGTHDMAAWQQLAADTSAWVRRSVLRNPNAPEEAKVVAYLSGT